jgi:hypothetical protein
MKRKFALMLLLAALLLLSACADGPLIATATPQPTPVPSPEPTPEILYQEDVMWPEEGMAALLPTFSPMLDVMTQTGEELFFAAFTEPDGRVIDQYLEALKEAGYTDVEEESETLYIAALEGTEGLLKVQLWYESGGGTLQLVDHRE